MVFKDIIFIFNTVMENVLHENMAPLEASPEAYLLLVKENQTLTSELKQLKTDYLFLKHELDKLKRMIFGSKSERFIGANDSAQLMLGLTIAPPEPLEPATETVTYERKKATKEDLKIHSRQPLPSHLPRIEVLIEPTEDTTGAKKIGEEITEVLEYTPGKLYVKRYIRPKYVMPQEKGIVVGELPSLPIPKGNAGASLISHIIISKFVDHLPFYRQVQMFKRLDVAIAESTINDWFKSGCTLMEPLYQNLVEQVVRGSYLMADETPIPVLDRDKPGTTHQGYHWVYYSPLEKLVCFDYQKGRGREGPVNFLKDFRGTLQTDGYVGYDIFENKEGYTMLSCMAHARRYFEQAKDNDPQRAEYVLSQIQKLYQVERIAHEEAFSFEARKQIRQQESLPVLLELEDYLKKNIIEILPKSAIGVAIGYALGRWNRLKRYIDDGRYEIDNNPIENSIRPVALGRKNYLFAGSHQAAQCAAMIYSFLGSCKKNDVNPSDWLTDVLTRLPDHKANRLHELLPHNWKTQQANIDSAF
jgi:transposase